MSHVTTIARDSAKGIGNTLTSRIGAMALSLVVGVAIGYALVETEGTESGGQATAATGDGHEEFLRLNTTALGFGPATPTSPAVIRSVAPADHFTRINTTGLESLAPRAVAPTVDQNFLDMNIATFEGVQPTGTPGVEPIVSGGYDFKYWNVGSLEWRLPAYSQSGIGPR